MRATLHSAGSANWSARAGFPGDTNLPVTTFLFTRNLNHGQDTRALFTVQKHRYPVSPVSPRYRARCALRWYGRARAARRRSQGKWCD